MDEDIEEVKLVFKRLESALQQEYPLLLPKEGLILNPGFSDGPFRSCLVYPLKVIPTPEAKLDGLLLGPLQITFSLEKLTQDLLISSYQLNFSVRTYHGRVLKSDQSILVFDSSNLEIQMSESFIKILERMNKYLQEQNNGQGFSYCSGLQSMKRILHLDSVFVEPTGNESSTIVRTRNCLFLVESERLFSDDDSKSIKSPTKCSRCEELEEKLNGVALLKKLPPGIAIKSVPRPTENARPNKYPSVSDPETSKEFTKPIVTSKPVPSPVQMKRSGTFLSAEAIIPKRRVIENIPVIKEVASVGTVVSKVVAAALETNNDDEDSDFDIDALENDILQGLSGDDESNEPEYVCKRCQQRYTNQTIYKRHLKSCKGTQKTEIPTLKCQICQRSFRSEVFYKVHIKKCSTTSASSVPMVKKIRVENGAKKFVCKYCNEEFIQELDIFRHLELCSKKPDKFPCKNCGKDFKHEINLEKHNARCVGKRMAANSDPTFEEGGLQSSDSKDDRVSAAEQCPICLRHLTKGMNYSKHIQLHVERLPEIKKPASCPRCKPSQEFKDRIELNIHFLSSHPSPAEPKIPCAQCLELVTKGLINQHLLRKHPHQPVLCTECGMSFRAPSLLSRHLRAQHNVGPTEKWMCDICGNVYREWHGLRQHMQTTHFKKKDHICFECGKCFISPQKLKQHNRIHTGSKPYGCSMCGYRCNRSYNVYAHLRKVHQISKPSLKRDIVVFEEELKIEVAKREEEEKAAAKESEVIEQLKFAETEQNTEIWQ